SSYTHTEDPLYHPVVIHVKERQCRYTMSFKRAIEDNNNTTFTKKIEVYTSNNPVMTLSEFKPNFYDLLLVDINMPYMNGFQLCEKKLAIDINVRICFMSSGEINRKALHESPLIGFTLDLVKFAYQKQC